MAKKDRLKELEVQKGNLERLIPPLVNRGGQKLAAEKLGVSQATISKWLKDHRYVASTIWQKQTTPSDMADIERAHDSMNAWRAEQGLPSIEEEVESWTS